MQREQDLALLPQTEIPPFTPSLGTSADLAIALLIHYSFELSGYQASELVHRWQQQYSDSWLHMAVIEALYQGRYKAISVQQILTLWQRRGQAVFHFNMEFERLICSKFPESLTSVPTWSQFSSYHNPRLDEVKKENVGTGGHKDAGTRGHGGQGGQGGQGGHGGQGGQGDMGTQGHEDTERYLNNFSASPTHSVTASSSLPATPTPKPQRKLLPATVNHSPIEQFTPQTSDRSQSFTSKLKAMSNDNL
ncbi:MAG: hypothetical protein KME28_19220 [Pelatocladus maniniholoensis HA4357-MV3]|jgi:hypothetical protein|uniref:Uncharacterized protein n=1 Tax=Pelatocladus maniniholoensis HA4357-MV3 TaxID=1117104 RepID=A0A9E3LUM7_9NOST|nr:hypothetical protein [Pelatocladus maniniholoensis HA4357-MV3]BAZ69297.1 hypothetical protein NIES4106_40680 [Fischerella sp. NIES-4106]